MTSNFKLAYVERKPFLELTTAIRLQTINKVFLGEPFRRIPGRVTPQKISKYFSLKYLLIIKKKLELWLTLLKKLIFGESICKGFPGRVVPPNHDEISVVSSHAKLTHVPLPFSHTFGLNTTFCHCITASSTV